MSDTVISVESLSKSYIVGHEGPRERYHSLRDSLVRHGKNYVRKAVDMACGRQIIQGDSVEEFWALKDVSFEVKRGEVLGIVGRNGAGKSTLLKILSRITEPTSGRVTLRGRVASLLEVGTGFHPELSGRENIFLNAAILGMRRWEVKLKFDEIVDFAGVEKFLDTPVKRYSSGMYVRLAFAVAAYLESEILVIDEVLAVGDAEFQKKCLGKMYDVAQGGRTVLFVSHQLNAIRQLCERGLHLKAGRLVDDGRPSTVIDQYLSQAVEGIDGGRFVRGARKPAESAFYVSEVIVSDRINGEPRSHFECDDVIFISILYSAERVVHGLYGYLTLQRNDGTLIYEGDSFDTEPNPLGQIAAGKGVIHIRIPQRLLATGNYLVYLNFSSGQDVDGPNIDSPGIVAEFGLSDNHTKRGNSRQGYLSTRFNWQVCED
jgi:ABC-type polysaccharide/polyol phosphate transport system ATPase subunit